MSEAGAKGGAKAPLGVGICGLGTVAQGVLTLLDDNGQLIRRRSGRPIRVVRVASRRLRPEVDLGDIPFSTNLADVVSDPAVDVVVELIGGETDARNLVRQALEAGKPVVTANKALLALHGDELFALAAERGLSLGFEAAVAGGIPVIRAIDQALAGNRIHSLAGIINGTGNFILTAMAEEGASFEAALAEAQRRGYAEADPSFDVDGTDAAHKLTILAALAFDVGFRFDRVYTEGISHLTADDIEYARQLGYRLKHLGIARNREAGIETRVHPALVPEQRLLANVDGVMNAVFVNSDAAGDTLYYGAGAGGAPTASSVLGDLVDLAVGAARPLPLRDGGAELPVLPVSEAHCGFYLRIPVRDEPGVFARIATILSEHEISIDAVIQREHSVQAEQSAAWVPIVILTHPVREALMDEALAAVQALPAVADRITRIRIESLDE